MKVPTICNISNFKKENQENNKKRNKKEEKNTKSFEDIFLEELIKFKKE